MPGGVALALALVVLGATLAAAANPGYLPEAVVAGGGATLLLAVGVVSRA